MKKECLDLVKTFAEERGLDLDKEVLDQFVEQFDFQKAKGFTKAQMAANLMSIIDDFDTKIANREASANMLTLIKRQVMIKSIADFAKTKDGGKLSFEEGKKAILAVIEGSGKEVGLRGSNIDVEDVRSNYMARFASYWRNAIGDDLPLFASSKLSKEFYIELDAIQSNMPTGLSQSEDALRMAQKFNTFQNAIFEDVKLVDPMIDRIRNYFHKVIHNADKIKSAPEEDWLNLALKVYGKKSFPGLSNDQKVEVFKSIRKKIINGVYGSIHDGVDEEADSFLLPTLGNFNVAKKIAKHRSLIPESAELFHEYQTAFGKDFNKVVMDMISNRARDVALLDKFGSNVAFTVAGLRRSVGGFIKPDDADRWNKEIDTVLNQSLSTIFGRATQSATTTRAKIGESAMIVQSLANLGGQALSSLPDLASILLSTRGLDNKNVFQSMFEVMGSYVKQVMPFSNKKELLEDMDIFLMSHYSELFTGLGVSSDTGVKAKIMNALGSITLMNRHYEAAATAAATVASRSIRKIADIEFSALSKSNRSFFERYNIGENEWNAIRKANEDWGTASHHNFITAESIRNLPDEVMIDYVNRITKTNRKVTQREIKYYKSDLSTKYSVMLHEMTRLGTSTPGTAEKRVMYKGESIDANLMRRFVFQWKGSALVAYNNYKRAFLSAQGRSDKAGVFAIMLYAVGLWSAQYYIKQALMGKTPEDPVTPEFAMKAVLGSGGLGIFAEQIIDAATADNEYEQWKRLGSGVVGPVLGDTFDVGFAAFRSAQQKDASVLGKRVGKVAVSNLPFQNLFWTRAFYDYMITNQLKESLDSGYINRLKRKTRQTPGLLEEKQRYYMLEPSR